MRVILADDALLFREGTARMLAEAGFEVTGQARDAAGLLRLVRDHPPNAAVRHASGLALAVDEKIGC